MEKKPKVAKEENKLQAVVKSAEEKKGSSETNVEKTEKIKK